MDIHVYDTYVEAKDGHTMHFDVITDVQDHDKAIEYAKQWLSTIGEGDATVTGSLAYRSKIVSTKSNGTTLTTAESGTIILQSTDGAELTLPATAAGLRYTFIWVGTAGDDFDISPHADDKIMGSIVDNDMTNSSTRIVTASNNGGGTDNKDLKLDAGSKVGDRVTIVGDGVNGWYIEEAVGSWAFQP